MKADYDKWVQATVNLKERRKKQPSVSDNPTYKNPVADYRLHLIKCGYGQSVIDWGAGAQFLKTQISERTKYIPVDAFPAEGYEDTTLPYPIESPEARELRADTSVAFAVLDNCLDFDEAIKTLKITTKKNIIILTGIDIDVDIYHTHKLFLSDFDTRFTDWKCTHREEIVPKVYLLCYESI